MPLGQGFLNSWLKVNSKHVVIPNKNDKEGKVEGLKPARKNNSFETAKTANTTKLGEQERKQIARRFSNRRNRRRLVRTISASDLIRDKTSGKDSKKFFDDGVLDQSTSSKAASASSISIFGSNRSQSQTVPNSLYTCEHESKQQQHEESSSQLPAKPLHEEQDIDALETNETNGSLRFVAGFFGADIDTVDFKDTIGSKDGLIQSTRTTWKGRKDSSSVVSRDGMSLPARIKPKPPLGGMGIRFPPNIFALDGTSADKCKQCSRLEDELALAREDVEYLRGVSLRNEYSYSVGIQAKENAEMLERLSSKDEVESVHEAEIEGMKKEWAVVQDEMQQEILKYADLCVNLNEEAEFRTEEAMNLLVELNSVSRERDEMVTEVETLRAKVAEYEKRDEERRKAEHLLQQYEEHGLEFATQEIGARDAIIDDLSNRLEFALDTLTKEREAQNQRRQIIFPTQRTTQNSSTRAMEKELKATKESLLRAEQIIEMLRQQNNGGMKRE